MYILSQLKKKRGGGEKIYTSYLTVIRGNPIELRRPGFSKYIETWSKIIFLSPIISNIHK